MRLPWDEIAWVLLDMDGTLLDKHFDDYFWETLVPEKFAVRHGLSVSAAKTQLMARYRQQERTLNWTDIDYWSRELDLDIPALKEGIRHLIEVHPGTEEFLRFVRAMGKQVALVTNAHHKTLSLKMNHAGLLGYFDEVVSSFDLGCPKEDITFWETLHGRLGFEPRQALLVDDNAEALTAARRFGIGFPYFKSKSSSRQEAKANPDFPSIETFWQLME